MESGQFLRSTLGCNVKDEDDGKFAKTAARPRCIGGRLSALSEKSLLVTSCRHAIAVQHRLVGKICNEMFVVVNMVKFSNLHVELY